MDMNTVILKMEHIDKSFGDVEVIRDFSLEVHQGEKVVFAGASGSGKTTLLRMINYLEKPTKGTIWLEGEYVGGHYESGGMFVRDPPKVLAQKRKKIGMVFQNFNLFSHLTALQNIVIAQTKVLGLSKKEATEQAEILLEKVHLKDHCKKHPYQLSGGQQQRIAIARALAMKPKIMLFDEPTSALDPKLTNEVLEVMQDLAKENLTMVVVTHEMGFAKNFADKMIFLDEGRVLEEGPPRQFFEHPQHEKTKTFLSYCAFKEGEEIC